MRISISLFLLAAAGAVCLLSLAPTNCSGARDHLEGRWLQPEFIESSNTVSRASAQGTPQTTAVQVSAGVSAALPIKNQACISPTVGISSGQCVARSDCPNGSFVTTVCAAGLGCCDLAHIVAPRPRAAPKAKPTTIPSTPAAPLPIPTSGSARLSVAPAGPSRGQAQAGDNCSSNDDCRSNLCAMVDSRYGLCKIPKDGSCEGQDSQWCAGNTACFLDMYQNARCQ